MFKRRNPLTWAQWIREGIYPRAGWRRAAAYVAHRLRRLPDTPDKIARGVGIGAFVSFTPFFGLHFVLAALVAVVLRANVVAALLGTFVGNPLTFPFIAAGSMQIGHWILGRDAPPPGSDDGVLELFGGIFTDLWHNTLALMQGGAVDWTHVTDFLDRILLPYFVGGLLPGALIGFSIYRISRPLIAAYQSRRKHRLMKRFRERREAALRRAERKPPAQPAARPPAKPAERAVRPAAPPAPADAKGADGTSGSS